MKADKFDRRRALGLLGAGGLSTLILGACRGSGSDDSATTSASTTGVTASPPTTAAMFENAAACSVTPEQTEGPFYIDVDQIRGDIREDREGVRLKVAARVVDADGCTPIKDAVFDVWHADAAGQYSGFDGGPSAARRVGGGGSAPTSQTRYLRGAQITNADGIAEITTVYPGWYPGRTAHIHAKVYISNTEVLTTQLYFDEAVSDAVYGMAPYRSRGRRDRSNADDAIFNSRTVMTTSKDGDGYLGLITIGVAR